MNEPFSWSASRPAEVFLQFPKFCDSDYIKKLESFDALNNCSNSNCSYYWIHQTFSIENWWMSAEIEEETVLTKTNQVLRFSEMCRENSLNKTMLNKF